MRRIVVLIIIVVCIYGFIATQDNVSLRSYVDMRIDNLQQQINRRTEDMKNESTKALESLNSRLAAMNEFRQSLNDSNKNFVTKEIAERMDAEIKVLRSTMDEAKGKASQTALFFVGAISVFSLAIQVSKILIDINRRQK